SSTLLSFPGFPLPTICRAALSFIRHFDTKFLIADFDLVSLGQLAPAPRLCFSVYPHRTRLNQLLRFPAGLHGADEFEKLIQLNNHSAACTADEAGCCCWTIQTAKRTQSNRAMPWIK